MSNDGMVSRELEALLRAAAAVSADIAAEVQDVIRLGEEQPLDRSQAARLLHRIVSTIRARAEVRGDARVAAIVAGTAESVVEQILVLRDSYLAERNQYNASPSARSLVATGAGSDNSDPGPVRPTPVFHGREVPMNGRFVRTQDIALWEANDRLDIHLAQFRQRHGRKPSSQELLDIMLSRMVLPGLGSESGDDQFAIRSLAGSIAINGVRKPPILSKDGRLLDGNRRVAACHFILHGEEFSTEAKKRVGHIFVWQMTPHATTEQEEAVVVSLNFEPDHKQDWPEYVKARKVHDDWHAMLAVEPRNPSAQRQAAMKRELSLRFALGPDTHTVNRYLKMMEWASEFESHHINERKKDEFEVKHTASRYFQYFDELAKGTRAGVAKILSDDEGFKQLVFDLLYAGRFQSWKQIRDLKHVYANEEARTELRRAREAVDGDEAEERIDNAISIARTKSADNRTLAANTRIDAFVTWLEELPVSAFRDQMTPDTLKRLLGALNLVKPHADAVLGNGADG
jgi:hypothetical protein